MAESGYPVNSGIVTGSLSLFEVVSTTAPIFLLLAIGYLACRINLMPAASLQGMGKSVLYVMLPALIFNSLHKLELDEIINLRFLGSYALGSVCSFATAFLVGRRLFGNDLGNAGLKGMSCAVSNSAFFGWPVVLLVMPDAPSNTFPMVVMVENLIILPLGFLVLEFGFSRDKEAQKSLLKSWITVFKRVARNPLLMAVAAGIIASATHLPVPSAIDTAFGMMSKACAPVALLVIGGSLVGTRVAGQIAEITTFTLMKLTTHAIWVAIMATLVFGLEPQLRLIAIMMAAMPSFSMLAIIGNTFGQGRLCSSIVLCTTLLSFLSLTLLMTLLSIHP